jgi:hypothetical protein
MILQQWLQMFPTGQRTYSSHTLEFNDVVQAGSTCVAEDSPFHMRGLEFTALHNDVTGGVDGALGNIEAVVVILGEAKEDVDVSILCGSTNLSHLRGIIREGRFDVFGY